MQPSCNGQFCSTLCLYGEWDTLLNVIQIHGLCLEEENAGRPMLVSPVWRFRHTRHVPLERGGWGGFWSDISGSAHHLMCHLHRSPKHRNRPCRRWRVYIPPLHYQLPETSSLKTCSVEGGWCSSAQLQGEPLQHFV